MNPGLEYAYEIYKNIIEHEQKHLEDVHKFSQDLNQFLYHLNLRVGDLGELSMSLRINAENVDGETLIKLLQHCDKVHRQPGHKEADYQTICRAWRSKKDDEGFPV